MTNAKEYNVRPGRRIYWDGGVQRLPGFQLGFFIGIRYGILDFNIEVPGYRLMVQAFRATPDEFGNMEDPI